MKVTVITIVIAALVTFPKVLVKGIEELEIGGRAETIQTTALLRSARILRKDPETRGDLLSLRLLHCLKNYCKFIERYVCFRNFTSNIFLIRVWKKLLFHFFKNVFLICTD